jgi:3-oxoacyl-[acyl-carrier protein] reductase
MDHSTNADEHPRFGKGCGRLEGQVAVVTGADSGIGRATARLFAREGAKVICVDIRESGNRRIDKLIEQDGGTAVFVEGDVTKRPDCDKMITAALDHFGDLHILFNHVGGAIIGQIDELSDEDWNSVFDRNLNSVFHGVRASLPHFRRRGRGVIVNTASTYGLLATDRQPAYCASKGAVVLLTRQLAIDLAPNIRVNCVCPGATATPLILRKIEASVDPGQERARLEALNRCMNRLARPEEIAFGVLFLASNESSFVTGHTLVIDGGQTIDA